MGVFCPYLYGIIYMEDNSEVLYNDNDKLGKDKMCGVRI